MLTPVLILLATFVARQQHVLASIHDCWDQEKLNRMKFPLSQQEANDPSLGKFSKLLKCMMREQSKEPGGLQNMDWTQWQSVAGGGQFPPQWNNNPQQPNQPPGWIRPGQQWPQQGPGMPPQQGPGMPPIQQPRPGVHPDDYNNNRNQVPPAVGPQTPNNWPPPPPDRPPPPNGPPPGWDDGRDGNRKKNNRRKNKNNFEDNANNMDFIPSPDPSLMNQQQPPQSGNQQWGNLPNTVGAVNDEDSRSMTRNRQYGYAIMACAVVALAVLMVSAIFCCSSSNSTMSQPATQVSVQPPDTFSIYSYSKQPVVTDTLRSGPLGDTLRNETLRSAASPQYRVSDIDPDFARRFREEHY